VTAASTDEPDAAGPESPDGIAGRRDDDATGDDVTREDTPHQDTATGTSTGAGAAVVDRLRRDLGHHVPPHPAGTSGRAVLVWGLVASWLGFVGHQYFLYPSLPLLSDTTIRFGIVSGVIAVVVLIAPRLHAVVLGSLLWGIVLLWLAIDSALPVGLIDLDPRPAFTLYAAHLVLAVAQVPLIASAWGRLRPRR
jgi:hypothetical protein